MNVSSASSSIVPIAASTVTKSEQLNEGTRPDGDSDKDDSLKATATTQNKPVGASGNAINTYA